MLGDWNDPKSRLQQCCLLRRDPSEKEPQMPRYKYVTHTGGDVKHQFVAFLWYNIYDCPVSLHMLYKRRLVEPACRVLESMGPTNTRVYRVAVYFKGKRLADSEGPSIQQAEMSGGSSSVLRK